MENVMTPIPGNGIMPSLNGIEVMKFSMNISYLASVQCMT
jgi:hypothetical protein